MTEGYWINYDNGKVFTIDEHERWIRRYQNARMIGLKPSMIKGFDKFVVEKDREKFLIYLMRNAPLLRVRGHGNYYTFEFASRMKKTVLEAISDFLRDEAGAGPYTGLFIVNLETKEVIDMPFEVFDRYMMNDEEEKILRVAKVFKLKKGFMI